jgi:uncharacterized membrane protein
VIFVLLFAALFLSEQLTWKSGLGAGFVALGAVNGDQITHETIFTMEV